LTSEIAGATIRLANARIPVRNRLLFFKLEPPALQLGDKRLVRKFVV
jgi:hypothetical protein